MMELILFFASVSVLTIGTIILIFRLFRKKDFFSIILVVLIIASVYKVSFGLGVKNTQLDYVRAYYEPTKQLISQLSDLVKNGNMTDVKDKILYFGKEFNNINWRDLSEYRRLVNGEETGKS